MAADARIEADAIDNLLGIQALHLGIGVQLVEIGHAQRQIGVGKKLHGLGLGEAHDQRWDVLLDSALLQQLGEGARRLNKAFILGIRANDDAAGIKIVVQRLALAQKFGTEDDILAAHLFADGGGVANRNRGFDDHDGIRIILHHQLYYGLHSAGVEEILLAVIISRRGDNDEIGIAIGLLGIQGRYQIELLFGQIFFDILILNRGFFIIDQLHLFRHDIHGHYLMVLAQKCRNGKAHIAGAGHGNFQILEILHVYQAPFINIIIFN